MTGLPDATDPGPPGSGPLLSVRGLQVSFATRGGPVAAVRGVDLDVAPGEILALVGESGSGKSTTAHAVVGLLPRGGRRESGRVLFDGTDLMTLPDKALRARRGRDIGLVPQDPMVGLNPVQPVGRQVGEVLRIHGLARGDELRARAVDLLDRAGVPDPATRARQYPHELSGGLRQRVLIAIALAAGPRLLIADEPTSSLDVTVQRRILDHLTDLTREAGTAVLLITHDLAVAADRAQRIAVMSQGRIVELGPSQQVLEDPGHAYTRKLVEAAPSLTTARMVGRRPRPATPRGSEDLVAAKSLGKRYPGGLRAVEDVSFRIGRGETFALVGESGSGKTTTARMVARLTDVTAGQLLFEGRDITGLRGAELRRLRQRMQIVHQSPYASLDPRFSVERVVTEPLRAFGVGTSRERAARAAELLERVALPPALLRRRPAELSGGQRQRVAIARALALSPDLVICDEPTSALDVSVQGQILRLLADLQNELGVSYLFISHDLAVVRQVAHRVGVMRAGQLLESGATEELFASPSHPYTKELLAAIPGPEPRRIADLAKSSVIVRAQGSGSYGP